MADIYKINVTLGEIFPNEAEQVTAAQEALLKVQSESSVILASFNDKASAALAGISITNRLLDDLLKSGFACLLMAPDSGSIIQRLETAQNKPPELSFPYTAGILIYAQGPDIVSVTERYQALLNIINS